MSETNNTKNGPPSGVFEEQISLEAEREKSMILDRASKSEETSRKQSEDNVRQYRDAVMAKAKAQGIVDRQRLVSQAKLEIRRDELRLEENMLQGVLADVVNQVDSTRGTESYVLLLTNLAAEALLGLGEPEATLYIAERDLAMFTEKCLAKASEIAGKKLGVKANPVVKSLAERLGSAGENAMGVLAVSPNERVEYNNTLSGIVDRKQKRFRAIAFEHLLKETS